MDNTYVPKWSRPRTYLIGGPLSAIRVYRGQKVEVSSPNPAGIPAGLYWPQDLQDLLDSIYLLGASWVEVLRGYTTRTYCVESGPPYRKDPDTGEVLSRPATKDYVTGPLQALDTAAHIATLLPAGWHLDWRTDGQKPVSLHGDLRAAIAQGRVRAEYTLVDSLRGLGGTRLQDYAQTQVYIGVLAAANNYFGGTAGAVEVQRDPDTGEVRNTKALGRAREESSDTSPNYRARNTEDIEEVLATVVLSLIENDVPDTARLVDLHAEVLDTKAFGSYTSRKLTGLKVLGPKVRNWLHAYASQLQDKEEGYTFGHTTLAVHGKTRTRNLREVVLGLKRGQVLCASDTERTRVEEYLVALDYCPGVRVLCEDLGKRVTWRGHVKLVALRTFDGLRRTYTRESSLDYILQGGEDPDSPAQDFAILADPDSPEVRVLRNSEEEDIYFVALASIDRYAELQDWTTKRAEGAKEVLDYMLRGLDTARIADCTGLTLRTVRRRKVDVESALRPVFLAEEGPDWTHILSGIVRAEEDRLHSLATV